MLVIRDIKTGLLYDVEYDKKTDNYLLKQGDTIVKSIYPVRFKAMIHNYRYKRYDIVVDDNN